MHCQHIAAYFRNIVAHYQHFVAYYQHNAADDGDLRVQNPHVPQEKVVEDVCSVTSSAHLKCAASAP